MIFLWGKETFGEADMEAIPSVVSFTDTLEFPLNAGQGLRPAFPVATLPVYTDFGPEMPSIF